MPDRPFHNFQSPSFDVFHLQGLSIDRFRGSEMVKGSVVCCVERENEKAEQRDKASSVRRTTTLIRSAFLASDGLTAHNATTGNEKGNEVYYNISNLVHYFLV